MLGKTFYYILGLGLVTCSCNQSQSDAQQPDRFSDTVKSDIVKEEKNLQKINAMDTLALKRLSADQAQSKFGKPLKIEDFNLSQPLTEFRIELYNHIPERDRNSAKIKFRELTWGYDKNNNLTAWYQLKNEEWIFLNYSIWPKDAVF